MGNAGITWFGSVIPIFATNFQFRVAKSNSHHGNDSAENFSLRSSCYQAGSRSIQGDGKREGCQKSRQIREYRVSQCVDGSRYGSLPVTSNLFHEPLPRAIANCCLPLSTPLARLYIVLLS